MSGTRHELRTENFCFGAYIHLQQSISTLNILVHFVILEFPSCPLQTPFGVVRMAVVVVPFLYVGTLISKQFAALLEEHDIFVPDDDDD